MLGTTVVVVIAFIFLLVDVRGSSYTSFQHVKHAPACPLLVVPSPDGARKAALGLVSGLLASAFECSGGLLLVLPVCKHAKCCAADS